ncbi:M56 family metallopeptidase [Aeoliella mucimassa]|uniref:Regulatory protein BlaR1 n=1 Tax=Aeoliella mucimassa TaxID=2527972 RepID=A0A518AHD4_9BACT|nr:M56 family metallopeptidase [Aeoliella mucimassa]QDU54084.1 Regulatory protein BlaR1 [Aeoliella mucimassa]
MNQLHGWQLAGETMLHFLWVGTVAGVLIFAMRLLLRGSAANVRYLTTLLAFAALALAPAMIAAWLWQQDDWQLSHGQPIESVVALTDAPVDALPAERLSEPAEMVAEWQTAEAFDPPAPESWGNATTQLPWEETQSAEFHPSEPAPSEPEVIDLKYNPIEVPYEEQMPPANAPRIERTAVVGSETPADWAASVPENAPQSTDWQPIASATAEPTSQPATGSTAQLAMASNPWAQAFTAATHYLPWLWVIGTPVMFVLLATGLVGGDRLRQRAEMLTVGPVREAADRLQAALKIGQRVSVAVSDRVVQPVLVGIVRPLVLLPTAAINGWSPEEVEMALLHELAHVRRCDNLVNLVQRFVEAALFFHPVVWMVSRALRHDREQCCDAIVVAHTGTPEAYADLLIHVARTAAGQRVPAAAVAMAKHPLARRVRRILQLEDDPMLVSKRTFSLVALTLASVVALALWQGLPLSVAEDTVSEPELPAEAAETSDPSQPTPDVSVATDEQPEALEDNQAVDLLMTPAAEALLQKIISFVAEGDAAKIAATEDGKFQVLPHRMSSARRASPKATISLGKAEIMLSRLVFHGDKDNPVATRDYALGADFDQRVKHDVTLSLEVLQKDPFGPQVDCDWSWQGDDVLRVTCPAAAHWLLSEYLGAEGKVVEEDASHSDVEGQIAEDNITSPKVVAELWFDHSAEHVIFPNSQVKAIWQATQVELAKSHRVLDQAMLTLLEPSKTNSDTPRVDERWLMENLVVEFNEAGSIGFQLTSSEHGEEALDQILHAVADSYFVQTENNQSVAATDSEATADEAPADNAPTPDPSFTGTSKTYHFTADTPFSKVAPVLAAHQQAGHQVKMTNAGNEMLVVVTKPENEVAEHAVDMATIEGTEHTEDTAKPLQADIDFTGVIKTYHFTADTPMSEIAPLIAAHERAGHQVKLTRSHGKASIVVTKPAISAPPAETKSPFLSMEDQRIADLAYNLFNVEVSSLSEEQLQVAKEKGFAGGVSIDTYNYVVTGRGRIVVLQQGDILVGLHVWTTASLDQLGEVLRRDDLAEFNPLKFFVLRKQVIEPADLPGGDGGFGRGFGGSREGSREGGIMGGMGMEEDAPFEVEKTAEPIVEWKLITGRLSYDDKAWREEQMRLKEKAEQEEQAADAVDAPTTFHDPSENTSANIDPNDEIVDPTPSGPKLLYDGRTFDDWRDQWKNELKTENRTEAIKALRAFGRAGKGKEATETILEVAEEYSFNTWYGGSGNASAQQQLVSSIVWSFVDQNDSNPISIDVAMPVILEWYRENPEQHIDLTRIVMCSTASKSPATLDLVASYIGGDDKRLQMEALQHLVNADHKLENERTLEAIRTHLKSDDDEVVINALRLLTYYAYMQMHGMNNWGQNLVRVEPLMVSCLFHPSLEVRQAARTSLNKGDEEQLKPIVKLIAEVIREPRTSHQWQGVELYTIKSEQQMPEIRLAAIRALAAMETRSAPVVDDLKPWLAADDQPSLQTASRAALCSAFGALGDLKMGTDVEPNKVPGTWGTNLLEGSGVLSDNEEWNNEKFELLRKELRVEASKLLHPSSRMGGGLGGGGFGGGIDMGGGGAF